MRLFRMHRWLFLTCNRWNFSSYDRNHELLINILFRRNCNLLLRQLPSTFESYKTDKCIRKMYTPVPSDENLNKIIINLCRDVKEGRVSYNDLEVIVDMFEDNNRKLHDSLGILILKCCGELLPDVSLEKRQALCDRIWNMLKKKNIDLTVDHYNALLTTQAENYYSVDPTKFLKSMSVKPEQSTYYHLLNVAARTGNYKSVLNIIYVLRENGYPVNEIVFNALIHAYAVTGNISEAEKTIDAMKCAGYVPSSETYAQLAYGFAKAGDISNVLKLLKEKVWSMSSTMDVIKVLSLSGYGKFIPDILRSTKPLLKDENSKVSNVIVQLMHSNLMQDANAIVKHIFLDEECRCLRKGVAYCSLKEMIKLNVPVEALLNFSDEILNDKGTHDALLVAVEISLKLGNETLALKLFESLKEKNMPVRPHYYWPLLVRTHNNGGESSTYFIVEHMLGLDIKLDVETLSEFVFPYVNTADPYITLSKLDSYRVPRSCTLTALVTFLLNKHKLKECVGLCQKVRGKIDYQYIFKSLMTSFEATNDIDSCIYLLLKHPSAGYAFTIKFLINVINLSNTNNVYVESLIQFLHAIKRYNVNLYKSDITNISNKMTEIDFNEKEIPLKLLDNVTTIKTTRQPVSLSHLEYMNTNQLANHLIELKEKNMNTRGILRKLLQSACKANNSQQVEEAKKEFELHGFEWTAGMRAALFDFYVKNDMLEDAKIQLRKIESTCKGFRVDNFKIIKLAIALVKKDKTDEAISIIQNYKAVNQKTNVKRDCWQLLSTIAHSKHSADTQKLLNLLVQRGYCDIDNMLLGPIVRVHLINNDIRSAVNIFEECVASYRKTPLKQEIMSELMKQMKVSFSQYASKEIQRVYKLITDVHGKDAATVCLIIALAEWGHIKELQDVLKMNNVKSERLIEQLHSLPDDKLLTAAMNILQAKKHVHKCDLDPLYDLILSAYNKLGDCENAVELWKNMKEDSVVPTQEFQEHFLQLLTSHKFPIPVDFKISIHQ